MKIAFISNCYNHHQCFISRKLYELTKGEYRFIATTQMTDERKKLGYDEITDSFVIRADSPDAMEWTETADVLILAHSPSDLLKKRIQTKKLMFRYSEHLLKKGLQWWKYPLRFFRMHRNNPSDAPIYLLCASAYAARDFAHFGLFVGKAYKWGYFPECKRYEDVSSLISSKDKRELLWCGRFLDWKHPDDVLTLAKMLKADGYAFHMNIIGVGEMEQALKAKCVSDGLTDCVSFLGSMSPDKVRTYMERAGIYLFTSDIKEGWGAVLNEAMNSGCAVVASDKAGSTKYLIQDGENGYIYPFGRIDVLYDRVTQLLDDPKKQKNMGLQAYNTITEKWNADLAAERLVALAQQILDGNAKPNIFADGPCSNARDDD